MIRILLTIIITIIIVSCGDMKDQYNNLDRDMIIKKVYFFDGTIPKDPEIDPELEEFYYEFLDEVDRRGINIDPDTFEELKVIKFGETDTDVAGVCTRFESTQYPLQGSILYSQITISDKSRDYSYLERKGLMFHELGHCLLNKGHTSDNSSIMSPNILPGIYYELYWPELLDSFFKEKRRF